MGEAEGLGGGEEGTTGVLVGEEAKEILNSVGEEEEFEAEMVREGRRRRG